MKNFLVLFLLFSFFACHETKNENDLFSKLRGVEWENSAIDAIVFTDSLVFVKTAGRYAFVSPFEYKIQSDTIFLNNSDSNWILRIKDKPFWPTGKILGQRVRTKHNVRVSFGEIGKENKHFLEIDSLDSNPKK